MESFRSSLTDVKFTDDDVDPLEYNNEKNQQQQPPQMQQGDGQNVGIHFKMPFQEKHDSVMIQPK